MNNELMLLIGVLEGAALTVRPGGLYGCATMPLACVIALRVTIPNACALCLPGRERGGMNTRALPSAQGLTQQPVYR